MVEVWIEDLNQVHIVVVVDKVVDGISFAIYPLAKPPMVLEHPSHCDTSLIRIACLTKEWPLLAMLTRS